AASPMRLLAESSAKDAQPNRDSSRSLWWRHNDPEFAAPWENLKGKDSPLRRARIRARARQLLCAKETSSGKSRVKYSSGANSELEEPISPGPLLRHAAIVKLEPPTSRPAKTACTKADWRR